MVTFRGVTHLTAQSPDNFAKLKERLKREGISPFNYEFKDATKYAPKLFSESDNLAHSFLVTGEDIEPMKSGIYSLSKMVTLAKEKLDITDLDKTFQKVIALIIGDKHNKRITFHDNITRR